MIDLLAQTFAGRGCKPEAAIPTVPSRNRDGTENGAVE